MFFHGRENYRRNADLIVYTFYKNMLYCFVQFWFAFYNGFSGQMMFEPMIFNLFNICFTGLPIIFYALYDLEYAKCFDNSCRLLQDPWLYRIGIECTHFNDFRFWLWFAYGCAHSGMIYFVCGYAVTDTYADESGRDYGFWEIGQNMYCCCILLATAKFLQI